MYDYDDYYYREYYYYPKKEEDTSACDTGMLVLIFGLVAVAVAAMAKVTAFFVRLFFNHAIVMDSIHCGIIAAIAAYFLLTFHPVLCVLLGLALAAALYFVQQTKVGFWIFASLFSTLRAFAAACVAYLSSEQSRIWFCVALIPTFALSLWAYIHTRKRKLSQETSICNE